MIEVYPNLWVGGNEVCYSLIEHKSGWATVHACKEPYHRRALGYSGRSAQRTIQTIWLLSGGDLRCR